MRGVRAKWRNAFRILARMPRRGLEVLKQQGLLAFLRLVATSLRTPDFIRHDLGRGSDISQGPSGFGVNLAGFFTGQFGIAASARAFAEALKLAEVPYVLNNVVAEIHGERRKVSTVFARANPYAINLVHVNADLAERFSRSAGPRYSRKRHSIGLWYWELSRFPARLSPVFRLFDEIWVTSSFTKNALSRVSPIPVVKMRYPLFLDTSVVDTRARSRFGLRDDDYAFLFMFDFAGIFERKNALGLLKAFAQAFEGNEKAVLVLNHINSWLDPAGAKSLRKVSCGLNVRMLTRHLSEQDYLSLLSACDCYASLHRSEGLGLTLAQAMFLGKPVIATAYSGNMDFMNSRNSLPVKYRLVKLERDFGPYEKGGEWAEPDIDHAAELMRWVYENRDEASTLGRTGSEEIKRYMNPTVASNEIRTRLERIYQNPRKRP